MSIFKKLSKSIVSVALALTMVVGMTVPAFAGAMHKVTFMYGTKQYVINVEDGCTALPPTDTYIPGYNFMGWVGNFTNITTDTIILGAYDKVQDPVPTPAPAPSDQTYEVKFVDTLTGAVYYHQTVSAGADATPPEIPYHSGYHFDGYDGSFTNVTSDRTVYCKYGWDAYYHDDYDDWWWLYEDTDNFGYYDWWWLS